MLWFKVHYTNSERDKRLKDFEKVGQLESKLVSELDLLKSRISSLSTNLDSIQNIDQIKHDGEQTKIVPPSNQEKQ